MTRFYWFDVEKILAGKFSIKSWVDSITKGFICYKAKILGF